MIKVEALSVATNAINNMPPSTAAPPVLMGMKKDLKM